MRVEIITVGNEILSGDILNTNTKYISEKLMEIGIQAHYHTTVGDIKESIIEATMFGLQRSDILIYTGGLGPTQDDLTKEAVCEVLDIDLELREDIVVLIEKIFEKKHITMPKSNLKQAFIPKGGEALPNAFGTAPGVFINYNNKLVFLLPGPPKEMKPMFNDTIVPILKNKLNYVIISKTIKTIGIGESSLEEKINDIIKNNKDLFIATYAGDGLVDIKITCQKQNKLEANERINIVLEKLDKLIGKCIYSHDGESIEKVVFKLLAKHKLRIGFCESCTGGLISSRLTKISGVSAVFDRGIVTYSNDAKIEELNVSETTLMKFGAVSKETAEEMAKGLLIREKVDIAVSVTGIAGPDGGTKDKPVGLVYIALASEDYLCALKFDFSGSRESIQNRVSNAAFNLVRKFLIEKNNLK